jgi:hypothetical protein
MKWKLVTLRSVRLKWKTRETFSLQATQSFALCHFGEIKCDTKRNHTKAFIYRSCMTMTAVYNKRFLFGRRSPAYQHRLINSQFMHYLLLLQVTLYETSNSEIVNDQRDTHVFNLFIYLLLPYMFRAFF